MAYFNCLYFKQIYSIRKNQKKDSLSHFQRVIAFAEDIIPEP